ncbi:MAG: hypothetical protein WCG35_07460 [Betaproteobacteria bacterium]
MDSIIFSIMQKHPEAEWLERCRVALPDASDSYIFTAFEILSGGDLHVVIDEKTD